MIKKMAKRYSEIFKQKAVKNLDELRHNGFVDIDGYRFANVRELCRELGISSYTIYKWDKNVDRLLKLDPIDEINGNPLVDTLDEIQEMIKKQKTKQNHFDPEPKKAEDNRLIIRSEIRYFGNLASMLNIKGYSDMPLKQLQLAIGLKLVQRSKLA